MVGAVKDLLRRINNDTLIIIGLTVIAIIYSVNNTGEQVVTAIIAGFIGYIRGLSD